MLTLTITGFEADPHRVTDILGIQATSTARKGGLGKSGRPQTFNGWWLDVHPEPLGDGESHARAVAAMVSLLRGRNGAFKRVRDELKPKPITIYGGFYVKAGG